MTTSAAPLSRPLPRPPLREVLRSAWPPFALTLVGFVLLMAAVVHASDTRRLNALREAEREDLERWARQVVERVRTAENDLKYLADVQRAVTPYGAARAAAALHRFAEHHPGYDQLRVLGRDGQERIRINHRASRPRQVPDASLQNKSARRYVREGLKLGVGEVFLSPFSLNFEHGAVEQPPRRQLRIVTPIPTPEGTPGELLVLNLRGDRLTAPLAEAANTAPGRLLLFSRTGALAFASAPPSSRSIAGQRRGPDTVPAFLHAYPAVSVARMQAERGQLADGDDLITFTTVRHRAAPAPLLDPRLNDQAWTLVSVVRDAPGLRPTVAKLVPPRAAPLVAFFAALSAVASYVLARTRLEKQQASRQVLESERLAAIGAAMTGLAHESRNALQRAQACVERIERRVGDRDDVRDLLGRLSTAQYDLQRLYEEVRDWAAPISLRLEAVDLLALLRVTVDEVCGGREDVVLSIGDGDGDAVVEGDPFLLRQVLRNVLENATLHDDSRAGPVELTVSWGERALGPKAGLALMIADDGGGMTDEIRNRIFEPFFTTRARGTGLGMAIARRIVEAHHGSIKVTSALGEGTVVLMSFPRRQP